MKRILQKRRECIAARAAVQEGFIRDFNYEQRINNNGLAYTSGGVYYGAEHPELSNFFSFRQVGEGDKQLGINLPQGKSNTATVVLGSTKGYAALAFYLDTSMEGFEAAPLRLQVPFFPAATGTPTCPKILTERSSAGFPKVEPIQNFPLLPRMPTEAASVSQPKNPAPKDG